jgi:glycosyltransferase involved in cell wall biosynthesis
VSEAVSRIGYRVGNPLVVSVSRSVRDDLVATQGLPEEDVRVIHNGVDLERFARGNHPSALTDLEKRIGKQLSGKVLVVFVGYEFDRKRLGVAISAVAGCGSPDVELVVAGKGAPERYRRQAAELGVADRVHFLGHCPDVESVLAAGHVFLFPTKYEAASLALLEAAAAGLAVVTTEVGMAAEMLEDGVSATLLPNTDDPGPATRALAAVADDPALRARLAAGAVSAASDCGWDRVWQRYRAVYDEVLDR